MFENAKLGDRVYCLLSGYGYICSIGRSNEYPIEVDFELKSMCKKVYTIEGREFITDITPILYHDKPQIVAAKKVTKYRLLLKAKRGLTISLDYYKNLDEYNNIEACEYTAIQVLESTAKEFQEYNSH